jgi:hypothetical protein
MSSQSYNSTAYNASTNYAFVPPNLGDYVGAGTPPGIPTRDASDYTRRLKQSKIQTYVSIRVAGVNTVHRIYLSNEARKSYQFGLLSCSQCNTGPFPDIPLNG